MAATMIATIKRFVGLSADAKPLDSTVERVGEGSTFFERDTGNMYIYAGGTWQLKDEANTILRLEIKNLMSELLMEAQKTNEQLALLVDAV